jgi:hypothetical protein
MVASGVAEDASNRRRLTLGGVGTLVSIGIALWAVPGIHDRIAGTPEVEGVVKQLDSSLDFSASSRRRMSDVNVEVNHCRMRPAEAAQRVDLLVTQRRQRLLGDIEEIGTPSDEQAQTLIAQFRNAVNRSAEADDSYVAWLQSWDSNYDDIKSSGCSGIPFSGLAWDAFEDDDRAAGEAKSDFLRTYNPIAKKYEERANWQPTDF